MKDQSSLRKLLLKQFEAKQAHVDFEQAVEGLKLDEVGIRPDGLSHSIWMLAEHMRIAQHDILEFSRNPDYQSLDWSDGYWPSSQAPDDENIWEETLAAFKKDQNEMAGMIRDSSNDLLRPFAHGNGQTLFREAMLIVDHNAYHIGQIIQIRRLLDNWS